MRERENTREERERERRERVDFLTRFAVGNGILYISVSYKIDPSNNSCYMALDLDLTNAKKGMETEINFNVYALA